MKILLFGEYSSNGNMILGYYQKAFAELGHEVKFLSMSSDGSDKSEISTIFTVEPLATYAYDPEIATSQASPVFNDPTTKEAIAKRAREGGALHSVAGE